MLPIPTTIITIHRIAECIHELQELKQLASLADFVDSSDGVDCVGLEIDLWTDEKTHIVYVALVLTRVVETEFGLQVQSEVSEFQQFPDTKHTAESISNWITSTLQKKKPKVKSVSAFTPDGASDGIAGARRLHNCRHAH